jgi:hypothetical protein
VAATHVEKAVHSLPGDPPHLDRLPQLQAAFDYPQGRPMDGIAVFEQADRLSYTPAPEQVIFPLQDGNFIAGFHYWADQEAPLVVLLHGASDSHTVFDFAHGFRIARPGTIGFSDPHGRPGGIRSGKPT